MIIALSTCFPKLFIVQKIQNFTATQILREINFVDSKSAKSAFLTHLEALNLDFL